MNNLTVFNNDIIPVYTTDTGEKVVIGREVRVVVLPSITSSPLTWQSISL